jgi:type IV secretory pathway protease TraF
LIAPTALLTLAAAKGIALGTWNIHQSKIPMEAAKIKASKTPKKVI